MKYTMSTKIDEIITYILTYIFYSGLFLILIWTSAEEFEIVNSCLTAFITSPFSFFVTSKFLTFFIFLKRKEKYAQKIKTTFENNLQNIYYSVQVIFFFTFLFAMIFSESLSLLSLNIIILIIIASNFFTPTKFDKEEFVQHIIKNESGSAFLQNKTICIITVIASIALPILIMYY